MLQPCWASPSEKLYERNTEIFDEWGICRTRAYESDGFFQVSGNAFRPIIAFESLGPEAEKAYELGGDYVDMYPDEKQRAEAIFTFVRDNIRYTSDLDQFGHKEFAQNADELVRAATDKRGGRGDCEDYAILLAVMLRGARLRAAVVLAPDHAAALVYLPEYHNANMVWELKGEKGWIWAEATGANNPLGWTPDPYVGDRLQAYEVTDQIDEIPERSDQLPGEVADVERLKGGNFVWQISPFFSMLLFMWIVSAAARALRGLA